MTNSLKLGAIVAGVMLLLATTAAVHAPTATASQFGRNLVRNGNAEANTGAASDTQIVRPADWRTTGQFTAVRYGIPGGFPDKHSPGPRNRGRNDFEGGNAPRSTATQSFSLLESAAAIREGACRYTFSAWLGGWENQDDHATATVTFLNAHGHSVGSVTLGPVTPQERHDVTGLLYRSRSGVVPKDATRADVTVVITRYEGTYNDGSADNISLVLMHSKSGR
ncbi:MAG: PEP-CTERM sorting domain-containing protein [Vulcanimicrobiaceae bacterium]